MKNNFQPDAANKKIRPGSMLIDPEAYDATEQQFAASVEAAPPNFMVEENPEDGLKAASLESDQNTVENVGIGETSRRLPQALALKPADDSQDADAAAEPSETHAKTNEDRLDPQDSESWRDEVAARLNNYRSRRRPREPRYPSLQLKFEEPAWSADATATEFSATPAPGHLAIPMQTSDLAPVLTAPLSPSPRILNPPANPAGSAFRIIQFPRSAAAPPMPLEELAEPMPGRPRILEAPEVAPPLPALGGISLAPAEEPAPERRPGFEVPLQSAPLAPRWLAAAVDGVLVLLAVALFGWIFFKMVISPPPLLRQLREMAVLVSAACWAAYEYLLVVYAGTTPGLKLARLRLRRFDGSPAPRRIRRWRVLASVLSAVSLGLGYAWCFLDEDELCWHDRITRTFLAPVTPPDLGKDSEA